MRIDAFEGRVKRLVLEKDDGRLTFSQLLFSFESSNNWKDLQNERSLLSKLFHHPILRDENQVEYLNVHRCILLGLVLCIGDKRLKARVLFDVLQSG